MNRPTHPLALAAGAFLLAALPLPAAQQTPLPALSGRVVDDAGMLAAAERTRLEADLARLEADTSVQLVVVTVPRIEGPIEDFSLRLAEAWEIGHSGSDTGLLLLVSRNDRQSRIEVGYGLEAAIPDGLAGRILRDELAPRFAAGDFESGLRAAAVALASAAAGAGDSPRRARPPRRGEGWRWIGILLFVLLGWLGNALSPLLSGGLGAMLGGIAALLFFGMFHLLWLVPAGLLGGFLAPVLVRGIESRRSMVLGAGMHLGSGGFSGGFSSGGFSGGGGSFGGGGASGSW